MANSPTSITAHIPAHHAHSVIELGLRVSPFAGEGPLVVAGARYRPEDGSILITFEIPSAIQPELTLAYAPDDLLAAEVPIRYV